MPHHRSRDAARSPARVVLKVAGKRARADIELAAHRAPPPAARGLVAVQRADRHAHRFATRRAEVSASTCNASSTPSTPKNATSSGSIAAPQLQACAAHVAGSTASTRSSRRSTRYDRSEHELSALTHGAYRRQVIEAPPFARAVVWRQAEWARDPSARAESQIDECAARHPANDDGCQRRPVSDPNT